MASNVREHVTHPRDLLVRWLARLYRHKLTTTTGGNLSVVDDDGVLWVTPSGGDKAIVPPDHVAFRRPGDVNFHGPLPPSMEWPLHTAAYEARNDVAARDGGDGGTGGVGDAPPAAAHNATASPVRAVLHAHSKTLMAFSLARYNHHDKSNKAVHNDDAGKRHRDDGDDDDPRIPNTRCMLHAYQACGKVAVAPYSMPGSQGLADACRREFAKGADCVILENHGVVVVGSSLHQAYDRFVSLEYLALSMVHAQPLELPPLPLQKSVLDAIERESRLVRNAIPPVFCPDGTTATKRRRVMTGPEKHLRSELCKFVHRAYEQNLITSSSGSFSVRLPRPTKCGIISNDDENGEDEEALEFLITPYGVDRLQLEEADVCLLVASSSHEGRPGGTTKDGDGEETTSGGYRVELRRSKVGNVDVISRPMDITLRHFPVHHPESDEQVAPSRASRIHAGIYRHHPEVQCVLITQPPCATAFCLTGCPLDSSLLPEAHVVLQDVTTVTLPDLMTTTRRTPEDEDGAATVSSKTNLSRALDPGRGRTNVLVQNYGVVSVGPSLLKTFVQLEVLESTASVTLQAMIRGRPLARLTKKQRLELAKAFLNKNGTPAH
jgi:L-fuculose-phosphate aldolase